MARGQVSGVFRGRGHEVRIVAFHADEAIPRGFGKRQSKLDAGHSSDQNFIQVFHGLDEVALPQDEVELVGVLDLDQCELK
jgi:hypothetical protein